TDGSLLEWQMQPFKKHRISIRCVDSHVPPLLQASLHASLASLNTDGSLLEWQMQPFKKHRMSIRCASSHKNLLTSKLDAGFYGCWPAVLDCYVQFLKL
ncbi:MAG: hypothetical protein LUC94_02380, partial [Clostridiales bacterium]|nr:hypothetical protein [Clostridiales bacterium]